MGDSVIAHMLESHRCQGASGTMSGAGLMVLGDEKAMAVVGKLVAAQAAVFAKASLDPLARQAAREAAMEAVTGSYVRLPHSPHDCGMILALCRQVPCSALLLVG